MKLSHRVLKSSQVIFEERPTYIDTMLEKECLFEGVEDSLDDQAKKELDLRLSHLTQMEQEAQTLLEKATAEKDTLLLEAKAKAELLQMDAEQAGYEAGKQKGYQDGHEAGYQDGHQSGLDEVAVLKQEVLDQLHRSRAEVLEYKSTKKQEILQLAIQMAEKILCRELEISEQNILELVQPELDTLSYEPDMLTLVVHPNQAAWLQENKERLDQLSPGTRFNVVSDRSLSEWAYVLESSRFLVELDIKKQLDAMYLELERM